MNFEKTEYGFWHQTDAKPFVYDEHYREIQKTTPEMAFLRLGWLDAFIPSDMMGGMTAVDIGSGNGNFVRYASPMFKRMVGFDLAGESITRDELESTEWDIIFLTDVLEHMPDINYLFKLKWRYCFLSYPEAPVVEDWKELETWRHFKPDEHIWMFDAMSIAKWLGENDIEIWGMSHIEDMIRKRWNPKKPNITTMLLRPYDSINYISADYLDHSSHP